MNKERLESTSGVLGVKSHVLEADIKELAWCWEMAVEDIDSPSPGALHSILSFLAKAYLRGRNIRMGNYQGLWRHLHKKGDIMRLVIEYVGEEKYLFDTLHKLGVLSVEKFMDAIITYERSRPDPERNYDILDEAEKILREKGN